MALEIVTHGSGEAEGDREDGADDQYEVEQVIVGMWVDIVDQQLGDIGIGQRLERDHNAD